jgi:hypothetical protein
LGFTSNPVKMSLKRYLTTASHKKYEIEAVLKVYYFYELAA